MATYTIDLLSGYGADNGFLFHAINDNTIYQYDDGAQQYTEDGLSVISSFGSELNKKLIFTESNIHFEDNPEIYVMMDWEIPLMKKHAEIVCRNGGDILEFGFGMGISANFIQSYDIKSHTIVEMHPQVLERLYVWSKNKPNVQIVEGKWEDNIELLTEFKFDGILFDIFDYVDDYKLKNLINTIIKPNGIFTYFEPNGLNLFNFNGIESESVVVNPQQNHYFNDKLAKVPYKQF